MVFLCLARMLFIPLTLQLYLITPYYRYYSLVLVVLSSNYNILLDAMRPNASIANMLLVRSLIHLSQQPSLTLVGRL